MKYKDDGMNFNTFKELYETRSFNDSSKDFRNNIFVGFKLFTLRYPFKKNINPYVVLNSSFDVKKMNFLGKLVMFDYLKNVYYYFLDNVSYDRKNKKYVFEDVDRGYSFDFKMLSDNVNNYVLKRKLKSKDKFGKCHSGSLDIVSKVNDSYICTGFIDNFGVDTLHTVVEFNDKYIIDYTLNIIIAKNVYYEITNFREIQRIKKEDYLSDLDTFDSNLETKTYLSFRDELINDFNRNKKVLKLGKEE